MSIKDLLKKTPLAKIYTDMKEKASREHYDSLSDEEFIREKFKEVFGREIDLENPVTFNEKLQWLKLHDRKPIYNTIVDKYAVKKYIADIIGEEHIIPTLGVWENFDDIDFDSLPDQFVLKCTNGSGGIVICRDKASFNKKQAKKIIDKALKTDYYIISREWPYKDVRPRVIAEKYLTDTPDTSSFTDYKFFCFDGVADNVMIVAGRSDNNTKFYHFDKNWNLCRYNRLCRSLPEGFTMDKPEQMDEMFEIAEKLSVGFPEVRVDLYISNGQIYFGELTLFSCGGFEDGFDIESDTYLGSLIRLPEKTT